MAKRTPRDAREGRVWNYLNKADLFWPITEWENHHREMALTAHKDNKMRFKFFQFLVGNGLEPNIAAEWVLMADVVNNQVVAGTYDAKAKEQIEQMKQQNQDGSLFRNYKWWDMNLRRVVTME